MKIMHRKQKGGQYALVFETDEEVRAFRHYVKCRNNLKNCKIDSVKNGKFHEILERCVLCRLPI